MTSRQERPAISASDKPQISSPPQPSIGRSSLLVAAGIFTSKIAGLVRESALAHFFGISFAADALRAALGIPNLLVNLFGEGVLSASFIPVYAKLLAQGEKEESSRVAGAIFSLLALVNSVLVLAGVLGARYLIAVIAWGFDESKKELTIQLVRIVFPGIGLLVLSAWCLGILNSHRKFFLSYVSPVAWNITIVAILLWFGRNPDLPRLAVYAAWGSVVGSGLQFLIQLPTVMRLAPGMKLSLGLGDENVRTVIRNFFPAFISRGVVQLSAYIDRFLASFLGTGAFAGINYAQTLYMLPVSLFGMSVSAAELPAMSSALGGEEEVAETLRRRISSSTRRIGFFVVPSAVAFLALGDVVAATIYQSGRFTHDHAVYVWAILAGSAVGLVASTVGRLYSSAYYALRDTRTPLRFAIVRVTLTTGLGYIFALPLPRLLGIDPKWGVAGLAASAGIAGWVEFLLLRRGMNRRIGQIESSAAYFAKLWIAAVLAAALAWGLKLWLHPHRPVLAAIAILIPFGLVYLGLTALFGINQAETLVRRFLKRG